MADAALVSKIKEGQRASQEWKQAWWNYCDANGEGKRDPAVQTNEFLQDFINSHSHIDLTNPRPTPSKRPGQPTSPPYGSPAATAEHQLLVTQVKQLQQSSQQGKQAWATWCIQWGGGNRDPNRHDVSFLKDFLYMNGVGTPGLGMGGMGMQPGMPVHPAMQMQMLGTGVGPVKEKLVKQIKELQRSSPEMKQNWQDYCVKYGQGRQDPMRHDVAFLQQFMNLQDESTKPVSIKRSKLPDVSAPSPMMGGYAGPGMSSVYEYQHEMLTKQIKDGQRISDDWKNAWWAWCDTHGDRKRDPARHSVAFLQEFISTRSSMGTVNVHSDDPVRQGLVKKIKEGQQKCPAWKEAWANYCTSSAQGNRDPNRHDTSSLEKFIAENSHLLE
jgi:hypothetical protein|uniref:Uncharacterized protein n=1 Tax=Eutreptiella gymnastica TaxID=73025 RepID=A0A7S4LBA0_9EUGL|mmetsp:Transcript_70706/g.118193  ORF Transcript_70706/g.118193 Transcript_70706/m.118193 type:complete len:384 (-) Transcript_70706:702-1853(-)